MAKKEITDETAEMRVPKKISDEDDEELELVPKPEGLKRKK